jgi:hypothetical protein
MTFDEHIDRLKERHEALTQSVELLLISQRENWQQIKANTDNIDKLIEVTNRDAQNIAALARIAESHERRLGDIEGHP